MNIADALSGHAGVKGIRWMLLAGAPHKALRRELCALLPSANMLGSCYVRHARFKPGRRLRANYDIRLRREEGARNIVRALEVTWRLDQENDQRERRDRVADFGGVQLEATRRGLSAPFRQLVTNLPAWGMEAQISPQDVRLPQLVRLSDPEYVNKMVAQACDANGQEQAVARHYAVESIRYRPGRRHVLRYEPMDTLRGETLFAKVYADENGERAARVAVEVAGWLQQHGRNVTSARPLAYVAEDRMVLYRQIAGESLCGYLRRNSTSMGQSLTAVGAALSALHQLPPGRVGPLKAHDFAAEVKKIGRSSGHIAVLLPAVGAAIEALLGRARELHERFPQVEPTFTHGDYISEHVWVTGEGITLIDLDNCRLADPALDLGKFLADLRFWYGLYKQEGLEEAQEKFLAGYGSSVPVERLVRARLYEAIELVKAVVRRVYIFERNWASRTERLIGVAQALMNDLHNPASRSGNHRSFIGKTQCVEETIGLGSGGERHG